MLIEVTEIHPPRIGGKVSYIHAADGAKFECWPDKLAGVEVGKKYEIETKEREYQGRTIVSIQKIKPARTATITLTETKEASSGSPGEAEYVGHVLAALILKGQIEKNQIATATAWLRKLWATNGESNA